MSLTVAVAIAAVLVLVFAAGYVIGRERLLHQLNRMRPYSDVMDVVRENHRRRRMAPWR